MTFWQKYGNWISITARYLIGIAIILWLLNTNLIDPRVLQLIDARIAVAGLLLIFVQVFLASWRVKLLLREHRIPVGIWRCMSYNCVGIFYSLFLPGGMSGDVARAYCFWRACPGANKAALLGALFMDRLLGTAAMVTIGLLAGTYLVSTLGLQRFVLASWVGFIGVLVAYVLILRLHHKGDKSNDRLTGRILRFIEKIDIQGYGLGIVVACSILGMAGHLCAVVTIYLCSDLVNSGLEFVQVLAVAPVGLLANALPLTPGGLGIGEKGFDLLYGMIGGVNGGNSFLLSRAFLFSPAVVGGVIVLYHFIVFHKTLGRSARAEENRRAAESNG